MKVIRNRRRKLMFSGIRVTRSYMALTADVGDALSPTRYGDERDSVFLRVEIDGSTIKIIPSNADDKQAYIFSKRAVQPNMYTSSRNTGRTLRALAPLGDYYWSDHLTFTLRPQGDGSPAANPELETISCIRARLVELDLLEQAINDGRDLEAFKLQRLEDLEARLRRATAKDSEAHLDQMSRVRSKANDLACQDKTMVGSESLRGYHYANALDQLTRELDSEHDIRWLAEEETRR